MGGRETTRIRARRRRAWTTVGLLAVSVCVAGRADALARARSTSSSGVLVPYDIIGNYEMRGGGHDATSYWIWYHDKYQPRLADYAIVVRVPGGLPENFPWALPPVAKPSVSGTRSVAIVGRTLTASDRASLRQNMLRVPRASFYTLAGAGAEAVDTAYRRLSAPHLSARLYTAARGSLSIGILYDMFAESPKTGPTGVAFGGGPPITSITGAGAVRCGGRASSSSVMVLILFTGTVNTFTILEDGHPAVSSTPAHDPVVPAIELFALAMPKTVHNIGYVVNHQAATSQSLSACLND